MASMRDMSFTELSECYSNSRDPHERRALTAYMRAIEESINSIQDQQWRWLDLSYKVLIAGLLLVVALGFSIAYIYS